MIRSLHVFLCHASQDKPAVRELHEHLAAEGWIDAWLDEDRLLLGEDWDMKIQKELEAADVVIVFISNAAVKKTGYVQKELRLIYDISFYKPEDTIFVIPLRLEECQPPWRFRLWQWGDYFGEKKGITYQNLLRSLKERYQQKLRLEAEETARKQVEKPLQQKKKEAREKMRREETEYEATNPIVGETNSTSPQISALNLSKREGKPARQFNARFFAVSSIILIGVAIFAVNSVLQNPTLLRPSNQKTATSTILLQAKTPKTTGTPVSQIFTPTFTPSSPTLIPTLGIGSTLKGKDGMTLLYVPEGEFTMGTNNGNPDEKPAHQVYLDAFWIDKTEVTFEMYNLCIANGDCEKLVAVSYSNSDMPIDSVTWYQANVYCTWAGRRLPTEAEWEKAARGTDQRIYPWGNSAPDSNLVHMNQYGSTTVGSYPEGASPFHALDMAGNLWEWVNDWYDENYYSNSSPSNPEGPASGASKVMRGGSWDFNADSKLLRTTVRARQKPFTVWIRLGFRCARSL